MTRRLPLAGLALLISCAASIPTVNIDSGDAARLVSVAGDASYQNYQIQLAPGTYALTDTLEMQAGQTIVGSNQYVDNDADGVWDPTDSTLDPADPAAVYAVAGTESVIDVSARTSDVGIILHAGNSLANVTVRGAGKAVESASPLDLKFLVNVQGPAVSSAPLSVFNCIIEGGYHGLGLYPDHAGYYTASYTNNIVRDNLENITLGVNSVDSGTLLLTLVQNRAMGFLGDHTPGQFGVILTMRSTNGSEATVNSSDNVVEKNTRQGVAVIGGYTAGQGSSSDPPAPTSNNNTVVWNSSGDEIWRNGDPSTSNASGGIFVAGALDQNLTLADSSVNSVTVNLLNTIFVKPGFPDDEQNQRVDISTGAATRNDVYVLGAAAPQCGTIGSNNQVMLNFYSAVSNDDALCGSASCSTIVLYDNLNADITHDNTVELTPVDATAFGELNPGLISVQPIESAGFCASTN